MFPALMRTLWQFNGSVRVYDPIGSAFKCRSGQATADDEYLGWFGTRPSDEEFTSPLIAFCGTPKTCHVPNTVTPAPSPGAISWRSGGQRNLNSIGLFGPVEATWPANGDVQWRSRIVLLGDAKPLAGREQRDEMRRKTYLRGLQSWSREHQHSGMCLDPLRSWNSFLVAPFRVWRRRGPAKKGCDADLLWRGNRNCA